MTSIYSKERKASQSPATRTSMHKEAYKLKFPRMHARVDPGTLTKDGKYATTYWTPQTTPIPLVSSKQVEEQEDRSTSPIMLPSLLDMIIDDLRLTKPLHPDFAKTLERAGDTMVHEYYAAKADKVIAHNRKNRAFDRGGKSLPQDGNMSWARELIDKNLAVAKLLVQSHVMQNNAENEQQTTPAAEQTNPPNSHKPEPARYSHTIQSLHMGLPDLLERHTLTTDPSSHTQVQSRDGHKSLLSRRATVETITDSSSDGSGRNTGHIVTDWSSDKPLNSHHNDVGGDSLAPDGEAKKHMITPVWRDEWAISGQGTYYA